MSRRGVRERLTGERSRSGRLPTRRGVRIEEALLLRNPGARRLRGDAGELRDDLAPVGGERVLLAVGHEVDVELVDADRLELAELVRALGGIADDAEAVADLVRDELAVRRTDAGV